MALLNNFDKITRQLQQIKVMLTVSYKTITYIFFITGLPQESSVTYFVLYVFFQTEFDDAHRHTADSVNNNNKELSEDLMQELINKMQTQTKQW